MKRSKIFLGVTTCLLAIAGVAAAKRFDTSKTRFYCTLGSGSTTYCKSAGVSTYTSSGQASDPIATITFKVNNNSHTQILYTAGVDGTLCGGATNCTQELHFSDKN